MGAAERAGMKALPHVLGASMAFVVLRQGFTLLGWISWVDAYGVRGDVRLSYELAWD